MSRKQICKFTGKPRFLSIAVGSIALGLLGVQDAEAATGFLLGQQTSGMSKVCYYSVLGSTYAINVGAVQLCPLTLDAPNPASNPTPGYQPPRPSQKMGFLTGEQKSGMNKICYYNVLGSTYTLTVSAVAICPISHQFF